MAYGSDATDGQAADQAGQCNHAQQQPAQKERLSGFRHGDNVGGGPDGCLLFHCQRMLCGGGVRTCRQFCTASIQSPTQPPTAARACTATATPADAFNRSGLT